VQTTATVFRNNKIKITELSHLDTSDIKLLYYWLFYDLVAFSAGASEESR